MSVGKFITLEGPDGVGKSTNFSVLVEQLQLRGYAVISMREPGGCLVSEEIRKLLLGSKLDVMTELLLFAAQRAENLAKIIKPHLAKGHIVVSDRFADSTYAYQGFGRGRHAEVLQLERMVLKDFEPDYTLFFDAPKEELDRRLKSRLQGSSIELDHFDKEVADFKERVYIGYQRRYIDHHHRMHRIDALPEPEVVAASVRSWVNHHFEDISHD